jgi:hypothetical protein
MSDLMQALKGKEAPKPEAKTTGLLTRQVAECEVVRIGDDVAVSWSAHKGKVRLHVCAPKGMRIEFGRGK